MMNDMSSGMKTHCESTELESHQMDNIFLSSFSFSSSSDGLVQNYVTLSWNHLALLCYYPYLVSLLFDDLLSLHLVTFLMLC